MFFSRGHANETKEAKQSLHNEQDLEIILQNTEPDAARRSTLLEIFKAVEATRSEYFNPADQEKYASRHGMLVYTNHDPSTSQLLINGVKAKALEENLSVYNPDGKEKIKSLLHQDGAIEVDAYTGQLKSYHRFIHSDPEEVAHQKGIIKEREILSSDKIGFDEKERKRLSGRSDYEGVGTRHHFAKAGTGIDPKVYMIVLSEETGAIVVMKDYKNLYSTIPSEIDPIYRQYIGQGATSQKSQSTKDNTNYHRVHEARGSPTISAEEALRLQLAILHEHKIANHHYI